MRPVTIGSQRAGLTSKTRSANARKRRRSRVQSVPGLLTCLRDDYRTIGIFTFLRPPAAGYIILFARFLGRNMRVLFRVAKDALATGTRSFAD